ncbi:MAG: low specificity L-threonine aldolase [Clostridia bacterium]|nr:low specificity L-threonine aldolase [Clostridia bacterium]
MISFESDYVAGAHPEILKRLAETNLECLPGYGTDRYCEQAKEKIRKFIGTDDADVELLAGGTQTNAVVISTMLADHEGVVAAETGHISVHEAGAVEYSGHKVLELPHVEGKLRAEVLEKYLTDFYADGTHCHMVFPGMVYISHPTEYETMYSKAELEALSGVCRRYGARLYLDGARLGYALASCKTDLSVSDIARLCNVFTIGGTKAGALCGEAAVFMRGCRPDHFMTSVKKRGALLAKGRLLGVQFDALFTDDLYMRISGHADAMARILKEVFAERGFEFLVDSDTNQQFVVFDNGLMERLSEKVSFSFWEKIGSTRSAVRFATGWSTSEQDIRKLAETLDILAAGK